MAALPPRMDTNKILHITLEASLTLGSQGGAEVLSTDLKLRTCSKRNIAPLLAGVLSYTRQAPSALGRSRAWPQPLKKTEAS